MLKNYTSAYGLLTIGSYQSVITDSDKTQAKTVKLASL